MVGHVALERQAQLSYPPYGPRRVVALPAVNKVLAFPLVQLDEILDADDAVLLRDDQLARVPSKDLEPRLVVLKRVAKRDVDGAEGLERAHRAEEVAVAHAHEHQLVEQLARNVGANLLRHRARLVVAHNAHARTHTHKCKGLFFDTQVTAPSLSTLGTPRAAAARPRATRARRSS